MAKDYSGKKGSETKPSSYTDSVIVVPNYRVIVPNHIYGRQGRAIHVCGFEHDGGFLLKMERLETPTTTDISKYIRDRALAIVSGEGRLVRMVDSLFVQLPENMIEHFSKNGADLIKAGKFEIADTVAGEFTFAPVDILNASKEKILEHFKDDTTYVIQYFFSIINRKVVSDLDVGKIPVFRDELVVLSQNLSRVFTENPEDVHKLPYASNSLIERFLDYKSYLVLDAYVDYVNSVEINKQDRKRKISKKKDDKSKPDKKDGTKDKSQGYKW